MRRLRELFFEDVRNAAIILSLSDARGVQLEDWREPLHVAQRGLAAVQPLGGVDQLRFDRGARLAFFVGGVFFAQRLELRFERGGFGAAGRRLVGVALERGAQLARIGGFCTQLFEFVAFLDKGL